MSRISTLSEWLLRQAAVWGTLSYLAFIALVVRSAPNDSWLALYFDGHLIKYVAGELFFVGAASLVLRTLRLFYEFSLLERTRLSAPPADGQTPSHCPALLTELEDSSEGVRDAYLIARLRQALEYVHQTGQPEALESRLHRLEQRDRCQMRHSYGLVRTIAVVMPILGLLGAVISVTPSLARIGVASDAWPAVATGVTAALDTTGLALALTITLLGLKYAVECLENRLLARVDVIAEAALLGRFQQLGLQNDPQVAAIRRMCEQMLNSVETASATQTQSISNTTTAMADTLAELGSRLAGALDGAVSKWSVAAATAGDSLRESLAGGVSLGLSQHAEALNRGVAQHSEDLRAMLVRHAEILSEGCDQYGERLIESLESHSLKLSGAVQSPTSEMVAALEALTTILPETIERHTSALTEALEHHTAILTETETQLADENRRHLSDVEAALGEALLVSATRQDKAIKQSEELLKEMQIALVEGAGATVAQQEQLIKQGEVLLRVVEATGQVRQLEDSLNQNLASLSASRNLEEVLMSLSGTLQLLCARMGESGRIVPRVVLTNDHPQSHAA